MPPKYVSLLAPIGAGLAVIFTSLAGYSMMQEIGLRMYGNRAVASPTGYLFGVYGMLVLGAGVTAISWSPRRLSGGAMLLFVGAMFAFGLAVIAIGFGTWELRIAFVNLATAASVEPDVLVSDIDMAWIPLVIGWGFVLSGAVLICAADLLAERSPPPVVRSRPQRIAIAASIFALLTFFLSGMWSVMARRSFERGLSAPQVEPSMIAGGVIGMVNSSFLVVIGLMCCGLVSLLLALSTIASTPVVAATERDFTDSCKS